MMNPSTELSARYLSTLRSHLRRHRPSNGDRAQGLGRTALSDGLATRDLAIMHERAASSLVSTQDFVNPGKD